MLKKITYGFIAAAALSLPLAPLAGADDEPDPTKNNPTHEVRSENPLSAEGLCGCDIPTLSVGGLLGHEEWADEGQHPLSVPGFPKFLQDISGQEPVTFGDGRNGIPANKG